MALSQHNQNLTAENKVEDAKLSDPSHTRPEKVKKELLTPNGNLLTEEIIKQLQSVELEKGYYKKGYYEHEGITFNLPLSIAVDEHNNIFPIYTNPKAKKTSAILGSGSSGKVGIAQCASPTGLSWCAQKTIFSDEVTLGNTFSEAKQELKTLRILGLTPTQMESPIVKQSSKGKGNRYKFFMNIAQGEMLHNLLYSCYGNILPKDPVKLLKISINFLQKLIKLHHEQKHLHRDIKKENVMIDIVTGEVTLVDWGFAKPMDRDRQYMDSDFHGSYSTMPPELANPNGPRGAYTYSEATEIFSAGILLFAILFGNVRRGRDISGIYWDSFYYSYTNPEDPEVMCVCSNDRMEYQLNHEIYDILHTMIKIDPKERPSLENVLKTFQKHLSLLEAPTQSHSDVVDKVSALRL